MATRGRPPKKVAPTPDLELQLARQEAERKAFIRWVGEHLTPGTDWKLIHRRGYNCPNQADATSQRCGTCGAIATLSKAGSEKVCIARRWVPRFRQDADTWMQLGSPEGVVAVICELHERDNPAVIVGEGRGARTLVQHDGDPNSTLKMAQNAAQTDAVLRAAGLSEHFTQDLDTMGPRPEGRPVRSGGIQHSQAPSSPTATGTPPSGATGSTKSAAAPTTAPDGPPAATPGAASSAGGQSVDAGGAAALPLLEHEIDFNGAKTRTAGIEAPTVAALMAATKDGAPAAFLDSWLQEHGLPKALRYLTEAQGQAILAALAALQPRTATQGNGGRQTPQDPQAVASARFQALDKALREGGQVQPGELENLFLAVWQKERMAQISPDDLVRTCIEIEQMARQDPAAFTLTLGRAGAGQ